MKTLPLMLAIFACASSALAQEGKHANSLPLNGAWQFVLGDGDEEAQAPQNQSKLKWQAVTLPGGSFTSFSDDAATKIKFVWARRTFAVSAE